MTVMRFRRKSGTSFYRGRVSSIQLGLVLLEGWFSICTDGSYSMGSEEIGAGGIICSFSGEFIRGFAAKQVGFSALHAELFGVFSRLVLARKLG